MRGRTFFLMGLALGLCGVPFACKRTDQRRGRDLVPVVVVAVDVPAGTVLTFDHLSQRSMPEAYVTPSMVKPASASYAVGQPLLNDLLAGDAVRWSDIGNQRQLLKPKTRLVTIDVEPSRAEIVARGDRVDVLATMVDPATHQTFAHTLIDNILVVGITPRAAMTTVQLLVVPDEAQTLLLAQDLGKFSLSLRSPEDTEILGPTRRTTVADLVQTTDGVQRCRWRIDPIHATP